MSTHEHSHPHTHESDHSHPHDSDAVQTHESDYTHTQPHSHHHTHSDEEKKAIQNRLSRAIGHLNKVKSMVENDADCSEVLIQLAAVRNAINNTGKVVLKNHMNHCIVHAIEDGDTETIEALNHAIDQFMK
ncbi:MAG: metal-sensing transcriptional repressor [Eubacterium sp.]|nr:metal-sensing transcriptional repressor [Eubacterium sp.]